MEMQAEEVKEIKNENLNDFAPENLQHSKLTPCINEHLVFKTSDFNSVYHKSENETLDLLKNCNFLKISNDSITYDDEQINCVFICEESYLNKELLKELRYLKDVNYNRFYKKKNNKWIFVPELKSKEAFLNYIREKNIKMFNLKKSSIMNTIAYYKESYNLKDRKNSDYSNSGNNKWRKYSKNTYGQHKGSHNSNYYSNNSYYKGYKGRERFNSDGNNNSKNNSYYYNYNSNYNSNNQNRKKEQIEVEIGEIKYPLTINHKYNINTLNNVYLKLKNEKFFDTKPNYLVEENEIINNKPKNIEIIQNTSSPNKSKRDQAFDQNNTDIENKSNLKMKIPKNNPLSQIKKAYNKFDAVPQNSIAVK